MLPCFTPSALLLDVNCCNCSHYRSDGGNSCKQEAVTLLEYSLNAVTEGIDAIATTRVVIRGDSNHTSRRALTGQEVQRTFRYVLLIK